MRVTIELAGEDATAQLKAIADALAGGTLEPNVSQVSIVGPGEGVSKSEVQDIIAAVKEDARSLQDASDALNAVPGAFASAAAAPSTNLTADTPDAELDAAGLPWDARIHSSGKTKYKGKNTWVYKRGVSDEIKDAVEAEHRSGTAVVAAPPPPADEAPLIHEQAPEPPQAPEGVTNYAEFVEYVLANSIDSDELKQALEHEGLTNLMQLPNNLGKLPAVCDFLGVPYVAQPNAE